MNPKKFLVLILLWHPTIAADQVKTPEPARGLPTVTNQPVMTRTPTNQPTLTKEPVTAPIATKTPVSQTTSTTRPVETKQPVMTPQPVDSKTQQPTTTEQPVATKQPATNQPIATKQPVLTPQPVVTKQPIPTPQPLDSKTSQPTLTKQPIPTPQPVGTKQPVPTEQPVRTPQPTQSPGPQPVATKEPVRTRQPTTTQPPTLSPSASPTQQPTTQPSTTPSASPTKQPTASPSITPTEAPVTSSPTSPPTAAPSMEPCIDVGEPPAILNAMFLIDGSHSIEPEDYVRQREFAAQLALDLPQSSRVAVMKFGTGIELVREFDVNEEFNKTAVAEYLFTLEYGGIVRPCICRSGAGSICTNQPWAQIRCGRRYPCETIYTHLGIEFDMIPKDMRDDIADYNCASHGNTNIKQAIQWTLNMFHDADVLQYHGNGQWNQIYIITDGKPHPNDDELDYYCPQTSGITDFIRAQSQDRLASTQVIVFGVGSAFTNVQTVENFECLYGSCLVNLRENEQEEVGCYTQHKMFLVNSFEDLSGLQFLPYCFQPGLNLGSPAHMLDNSQSTFESQHGLAVEQFVGIVIGTIVIACILAYLIYVCNRWRSKQTDLKLHEPRDFDEEWDDSEAANAFIDSDK